MTTMERYGSIQHSNTESDLPLASFSAENGPIGRFVLIRLMDGEPVNENGCHLVARRALQGGGVVMGTAGTVPFIPISMKLGGDNVAYGVALSAGNVGSFSSLNSWSLLKIIESEMTPLSPEEVELAKQDKSSSCVKTSLKAASFVVGFLCQVPLSYMAYVYNGEDKVAMAYGIFMMFSDSGVPIYSLLLTTDEVMMRKSMDETEKKLFKTKEHLIGRLDSNEQTLIELGAHERGEYLKALAALSVRDCPTREKMTEMFGRLFRPIRPRVEEVQQEESCLRTGGRYLAQIGGATLASARLFLSGYLGYQAMDLFTDSPEACYTAGIVIAACSSYLTFQAMNKTVRRTYDAAVDLLSCQSKPNLAFRLQPKLTAGLCLLGLGFTALSYGPSVQVCEDNFSGKTQSAMEVLVPMGTIIMVVNAMSDLINDVVVSYAGKWGTEEAKQLVDFHNKMQHFKRVLQRSPMIEHAKALELLPEEQLAECLQKADLATDELQRYISSHLNMPTRPLLEDAHSPLRTDTIQEV